MAVVAQPLIAQDAFQPIGKLDTFIFNQPHVDKMYLQYSVIMVFSFPFTPKVFTYNLQQSIIIE